MAIPSQDLMMMKRCTDCGETKPREDFPTRRTNNGKPCKPFPNPTCKVCACARSKRWRAAHLTKEYRDKWGANAKRRRQRVKDAVFAAYGGYRCACCGETERLFLSLDHIANNGAEFRREKFGARNYAGYRTYAWLLKNQFPEGYQVLCMNCNHGKLMNKGVCPHQVRCNDQSKDVGPSGPKRIAPILKIVNG